jgi:hypothetical protein
MDGAALVRIGRRLLAALEGQPSECPDCGGLGRTAIDEVEARSYASASAWLAREAATGRLVSVPCHLCRGTGHNLAGVLAPLEVSPQQRRKDARRDPVKEADGRANTTERRAARQTPRLGVARSLSEWEGLRVAAIEHMAHGALTTADAAHAFASGNYLEGIANTALAAERFVEGARLLGLPSEDAP